MYFFCTLRETLFFYQTHYPDFWWYIPFLYTAREEL